jgi:hypothetical protein
LRADGEIETTQENVRDWLGLYEGDPRFQLLREEQIFYLLSSALPVFFIFHLFVFYFFCLSGLTFASLIRMTFRPN